MTTFKDETTTDISLQLTYVCKREHIQYCLIKFKQNVINMVQQLKQQIYYL